MKQKKYWLGDVIHCDICGCNLVPGLHQKQKYFYDFKTIQGPWALGCQACFEKYSYDWKLGLGHGQKYLIKTKEKVEG
jgi:hypothetical protein